MNVLDNNILIIEKDGSVSIDTVVFKLEVERLVYNADAVTVVPAAEAEVMRAMTLYNEVEVDMFNLQLMPWSEQICR